MKKILIATPSYDGKVDVWYVSALHRTILLGAENNIYFHPIFMSYDALIQRSRNDLVAMAIENDFDGILWIDADIEWKPEWAIDAVSANKPVFGLPCIKKSLNEESYNIKCRIEDLNINDEGYISVESVGTGWLYLSKEAYMYLWDNSEPYVHNEQDRRWIFSVEIQDGDIVSEDVNMCKKLKEGGFEILIDPAKTCNHIGTLKYQGDFANFIGRVKEAALSSTK